jgi:protein TonB
MNRTQEATRVERGTATCLTVALGVSLLAHVAVLLRFAPFVAPTSSAPEPRLDEELVVQTLGLVSDRQVDEQRAGDGPERTSGASPQAAAKAARRSLRVNAVRAAESVLTAPSGDQPTHSFAGTEPDASAPTAQPEATDPTSGAPETTAPNAPTAPAGSGGGVDVDQAARTIRTPDPSDAVALRNYVVALRGVIQSRLVYPPEAREASYVGAPIIRFTVSQSGDILPGTLVVVRSSGRALLDENAIKAARESAPLPPPPHQITVSIAVAFVREPE